MHKVIVLGEGYVALGVIKAFAKEGISVILLFSHPNDHACHSKFTAQRVQIPNPMDDSAGLLALLMDPNRDWDGALLVPTLDEYVIFLSQNRAELQKRYVFTTQGWDVIGRIINKNFLYPQAQAAGVPTPKFFLPDSLDFIKARRDEFVFPCILKPIETHKFDRIYRKKILMVNHYDELVEKFQDTQKNKMAMMICEIIPGSDSSLFHYRSYIDSQGSVLAELCTQKIRQYPPGFGQAAVARTVPMIPEIRRQALDLLHCYGFRGESSAEFKLDPRDNVYKLMEINVRPVLPEWHFASAGVNFPYITYLDLIENTRIPVTTYRKDLYWIHNYWEMVNFVQSLKSGNLHLREFLNPYWQEKVFVVPFSDDPINFFKETFFNLRKAAGGLRKNGA